MSQKGSRALKKPRYHEYVVNKPVMDYDEYLSGIRNYALAMKEYRKSVISSISSLEDMSRLSLVQLDAYLKEHNASITGSRVVKEFRLRQILDGRPYIRAKRTQNTLDEPVEFLTFKAPPPQASGGILDFSVDVLREYVFSPVRKDCEFLFMACTVCKTFYAAAHILLRMDAIKTFGPLGTPMALLEQAKLFNANTLFDVKSLTKHFRLTTRQCREIQGSLPIEPDMVTLLHAFIQTAIETHGSIDVIPKLDHLKAQQAIAKQNEVAYTRTLVPSAVEEVNRLFVIKKYPMLAMEVHPVTSTKLRWQNPHIKTMLQLTLGLFEEKSIRHAICKFVFAGDRCEHLISSFCGRLHPSTPRVLDLILSRNILIPKWMKPYSPLASECVRRLLSKEVTIDFLGDSLDERLCDVFDETCYTLIEAYSYLNKRTAIVWSRSHKLAFHVFDRSIPDAVMVSSLFEWARAKGMHMSLLSPRNYAYIHCHME
jgi:hypothetical protein